MNIDRATIRLRDGKKLTIGYVIFNNKNETLEILSYLVVVLFLFMHPIMLLILLLKISLIIKECNIEVDDSGDHPDHKLMIHYNNLH